MFINPLTCIDFYKADHRSQYPKGTNLVYSNFTPRSSKHAEDAGYHTDEIVFFGLQYFIKYFIQDIFNSTFFKQDKQTVLDVYQKRMDGALGKNAITTEHIAALHDLGHLPIEIKAVPEGTKSKIGVPVLTIKNTKPEFFWLTNYLESVMSNMLWKPCTSATIAHEYRKVLNEYAEKTGAPKEFTDFQAHDFSFRGMSGVQDAASSGAGHLLSFKGTDTVVAIDFLEQFYGADAAKELVGASVPATEHSVMCMGTQENEIDTFRRLINETYPKGIVSIVSDTWDFWKVLTEYLPELRDDILKRDGKVVIRPDSGDPVDIICGKSVGPPDTSEGKGAVECLWDVFGGTVNEKGYKELANNIGLIYGDSITIDRAKEILSKLEKKGFASNNVVFGVGSYTYQYNTRDTFGFAVKSTYGEVDGVGREIFKDPVTDNGVKKSARGLLKVEDGVLLQQQSTDIGGDLLTVFRDGVIYNMQTLAEIRERVAT